MEEQESVERPVVSLEVEWVFAWRLGLHEHRFRGNGTDANATTVARTLGNRYVSESERLLQADVRRQQLLTLSCKRPHALGP